MKNILDLISSNDVRKYLKEINYKFSIKDQISIVLDKVYTLKELIEWGEYFYQNIDSEKESIMRFMEFIEDIKINIKNFKIYNDRPFKMSISEDDDILYSLNYNDLYNIGIKSNKNFTIEKMNFIGDSYNEQFIYFTDTGDIDVYNSCIDIEYPKELCKKCKYPIPFKNGDIIKICNYIPIGIINDDMSWTNDINNNDFVLYIESYDTKSKSFFHIHEDPANIEYYNGEIPKLYSYMQDIIKNSNYRILFNLVSYLSTFIKD